MTANHTRREILQSVLGLGIVSAGGYRFTSSSTMPSGLDQLTKKFEGVLLQPGDDGYNRARATASFNPRFDRKPRLIARCASEDDILRALEYGRVENLEIAVRSGGHDVLAASTCDDGLVIDLSTMSSVRMSDDGLVAAQCGARAGGVNSVLAKHGRATALGCNSTVGVSGLTLGGGLGWFVAKHGAACDVLESVRLVTVGGTTLNVNQEQNEDLFWAIRGGGGNFGIVSELSYRSFKQGDIISGVLIYPGAHVREVLQFYREELSRTSNDLTVEILGISYTEPLVICSFCYSGDLAKSDEVFAPWQRFLTPIANGLTRRPFIELERIPEHILPHFAWPGDPDTASARVPGSYWQGVGLERLTDHIIDEIAKIIEAAPFGAGWGLGHVQRGACIDEVNSNTPFIRRAGATSLQFNGAWEIEKRAASVMDWVDDAIKLIDPFSGQGDYINYLSTDDPARVRGAYAQHYERLSDIKRRYDPENILRRNRNIAPATA